MHRHQPSATHHRASARTGAADAPATVIYLDTVPSPGHWTAVITHLHQHLGGRIAQLTYTPPDMVDRASRRGALATDLDARLAETAGARVLVTRGQAVFPALCWAASAPQRAAAITGLVLFHPPASGHQILDGLDLDRLRATPTWVISTHTADPNDTDVARVLGELLWAEHDVITQPTNHLQCGLPVAAGDPILAALQVAHDTQLREGA